MNLPPNRSRLVALCQCASDAARAAWPSPSPLPLAQLVPHAGLSRMHAATLAGALDDPALAEVAHLGLACAEYLENALAVMAEREREQRAAVAAVMQGGASC